MEGQEGCREGSCLHKPHVELLVYFSCLKAEVKTASRERAEEMGSDSRNNGAAGRVKQPQSDLEQC